MDSSRTSFDRFLRAVYVRLVVVRTLERTGLGLLGGCAAALPLVCVLLARGQSARELAAVAMALGASAGLFVGITRRPSRLDAALQADRQLELQDLLSSAVLTRAEADSDPWAAALLAVADQRCAALSPSTVLLNHLGARAWSGIGLAGALLVTLASLTARPSGSSAGEVALAASRRVSTDAAADQPILALSRAPRDVPPTETDPVSETDPRLGAIDRSAAPDKPGPKSSDVNPNSIAGTSDNGHGDTQGHTTPPGNNPPAPVATRIAPTSEPAIGRIATGSGDPSSNSHGPDAAAGDLASSAAARTPPATPWQSPTWPSDVQRAHQSADSGQIPAAYHDLLRAYFTP